MEKSFIKKKIAMIFLFLILGTYNISADIIGDINNDNIVDTTEAVYALQVSAGISKNITSNANDHSLDASDGNPKNALYVDKDGKVGIGTSFPVADLCVKANQSFSRELTGRATVGKNSSRVNGVQTKFMEELSIGDNVLFAGQIVSIAEITDNEQLILNEAHPTGALDEKMYVSGNIISIQNILGQSKMVVDKKGNVGIGTSNPAAQLDVNGSFIRQTYRNSGFSESTFQSNSSEPEQVPGKTLIFNKLKNETSIKIEYSDFIGGYQNGGLAAILEIRVNGDQCPGGNLKYYNYMGDNDSVSRMHTNQTFKGFCDGLSAGIYEIQIWVYKYSNDYFGFNVGDNRARWTIEAEEVY